MDSLVPSSTDLEQRILQLLEGQSEPITAAFIGFALSEYPFETVSDSLDALWHSGRVTLDAYGYSLDQAEGPSGPAGQLAVDETQEEVPVSQEQKQQAVKDAEALARADTETEAVPSPAPQPSKISFSNAMRLDDDLKVFLASPSEEEERPETDVQPDLPQSHKTYEADAVGSIDSHKPTSAPEDEVAIIANDALPIDIVDESLEELDEPAPETELAPSPPYETVVAALAQDGLDDGLEVFSDIPFIGAPRKSFRDDADLLYAKLSGTSMGDGLEQYPDEPLIGIPQEETEAVSVEYLKMLEDYSSPEDSSARQILVQAHRTSQVEDEYQALLDMLFAPDMEPAYPEEESERPGEEAVPSSDKEEADEAFDLGKTISYTCWTPIEHLELSTRARTILGRHSVETVRDLVRHYDTLESEKGAGALTIREIGDALIAHSTDVSTKMDAAQMVALCQVSGSQKYVFDPFGRLQRVTHQSLGTLVALSHSSMAPLQGSQTPISELKLPNRLYNALRREGYTTVDEVSRLTEAELLSMRGVGVLAVSQLQDALSDLTGNVSRTLETKQPARISTNLGQKGRYDSLTGSEIRIADLALPNRLIKALSHAGYSTVGEVIALSDEELLSLRGVGILAVERLREVLADLEAPYIAQTHEAPKESQAHCSTEEVTQEPQEPLESIVRASDGAALALIVCKDRQYPVFDDSFMTVMPHTAIEEAGTDRNPDEYKEAIIDSIEGAAELVDACKSILYERVNPNQEPDVLESDESFTTVPDIPVWDKAAAELAEQVDICFYDDDLHAISIRYPHLMEWVEALEADERTLLVLRMYLDGHTLEECGQEVGLTRERVRQIVNRSFNGVPIVDENRYRHFYDTYRPSKAEFLSASGEPISTYIYLRATTKSKDGTWLPLAKAQNDQRVPQNVRDGVRRIMDKGFIYADGYRIQESKEAIITHLVMRHASTRLIKVEKLWKLYNQFLEDNGLSGRKKLQFNTKRSFEACLDRYEQILRLPHSVESVYGGSVRYYDAQNMDFAPLVKLLSSGVVDNVECSTAMLMDHEAFVDVLEELDIHNCYELHNVLSRYCPSVDGMRVGRSPNVTFGKGNRNDQILELIKELSPVSTQDLANAYSRHYGVDPATFMGSYLGAFKIYLKHGKYVYNDQGLSKEQAAFVKDQLEGSGRDYVSVSLLKARFRNRFPRSSTTLINGESVSRFGFHPSAGLLIRDGIDERDMFASLLDSKQRFSISDDEFGKDVFDNPAFKAELAIRVRACRLVEYEKDSYLASSIFSTQYVNLGEEDLRDYVDRAIEFMKPDTPYTVKSLVSSGFTHKIDVLRDDFGLGDYFFASLLGTGYVGGRLKGTSVGDTPVFCKTFYNYSAPVMAEQIVAQEGAIEIDDLSYLLEDDYGIQANNALLRMIIKRSDLYFSETLDMVFDSEETYRRKAQEWIS